MHLFEEIISTFSATLGLCPDCFYINLFSILYIVVERCFIISSEYIFVLQEFEVIILNILDANELILME